MAEATAEEVEAATKIAAIKQGQKGRAVANLKKSKVWQALGRDDAEGLAEALAAGSDGDASLADESGLTPLKAAIEQGKYECAKVLVNCDGALALPPAELAVWVKVQADKKTAADPEAEDPPDVADEEYQKGLAESLLGGGDPVDAAYAVKSIVRIGLYVGGRAPAADYVEKSFDTEVTDKLGFGVSLSPGGDVFVGEYGAGGLREGRGALRTASGTTYVGEWQAGQRHGLGSMTYADGGVYTGTWAYGKRHGRGTFNYNGKDTYTGEWHAGSKHGPGRYSSTAAGCVYEGQWAKGVLVASKVSSADGTSYFGKFDKQGRPVGDGAYVFQNGTTVKGKYNAPPPPEDADEEGGAPVEAAVWVGGECGSAEATTEGAFSAELCSVKPAINVVLAGAPASGKATQAEFIKEEFGLVHLSTGAFLKEAADGESDLGAKAKEAMEAGEPVADELVTAIVVERLSQPDCVEKGWLLDGFPTNQAQAEAMEKNFLIPSKAVVLDVPDEVLIERVTGRRSDPESGKVYHLKYSPPEGTEEEVAEITARLVQADADTEDAVKNRLVASAANREAVASTFKSVATNIDGNRDKQAVWEDIKKFLSE